MTHVSIIIEIPSLHCGLCRNSYHHGDADFQSNPPQALNLFLRPNSAGFNGSLAVYAPTSAPNRDADLEARAIEAGWIKVTPPRKTEPVLVCTFCQEVAKLFQHAKTEAAE